MDCCEFEPKIQVECVLEIIGIVKSGDLLAKKFYVMKKVACILGCLAEKFDGSEADDDTQPVFSTSRDNQKGELGGICKELELQLSGEGAQAPGPIVMMLIQQLVKLILRELL